MQSPIQTVGLHIDMFGHFPQRNTIGSTDSDRLSFTIMSKITLSYYNQASYYFHSGTVTICLSVRWLNWTGTFQSSFTVFPKLFYTIFGAAINIKKSCPRLSWTDKVFILLFIQGLSLGKESSKEAGKDILNYLQGGNLAKLCAAATI